jgi:hypothetical protein
MSHQDDLDAALRALGPLREVETVFQHWYELDDVEGIHVALAAVVANLQAGDPVWLFVVAPSGSLKTELIRALSGVDAVYPLSNLTAQTFASGYQTKGHEPSLLMRLDGRILTLKDFTTVLTMYRDKRSEILAQLREIYDGHYRKEFGNGKVVDWTGKVGLVAGVTPILDTYWSVNQVLGERFVLYRLGPPDARQAAKRAMRQAGQEAAMRTQVREAVRKAFDRFPKGPMADLSESLEQKFAALAVFTARARSGVLWDARRADIEYVPEAEGPGRLAKQFKTLAQGLARVRGRLVVGPAEYESIVRVAHDTVPAHRTLLLDHLVVRRGEALPTSEIAETIGYPTSSARRYLEELTAVHLVQRFRGDPGRSDEWALSTLAAELLHEADPEGA